MTITIPLRLKLKLIRSVGLGQDLDAEAMFRLLEALAPDEVDTIVEMDLNDFTAMFAAWQVEYQALAGASLGESSRSSS